MKTPVRDRDSSFDIRSRLVQAELPELLARNAREHGRACDLVAVQVQDRQHGAVARRVDELVRMPAGRERTRLRFAVADDAGDDQVGVVEDRAVGVRERPETRTGGTGA